MKLKVLITAERVAWFAAYIRQFPDGGVFWAALREHKYETAADKRFRELWAPDLREAAEWYDKLTATQRARLASRAKAVRP